MIQEKVNYFGVTIHRRSHQSRVKFRLASSIGICSMLKKHLHNSDMPSRRSKPQCGIAHFIFRLHLCAFTKKTKNLFSVAMLGSNVKFAHILALTL